MIKILVTHAWSLRREFMKYFVIGVCGVILDIGSLYVFKEYFHLRPVVAVIINQIFLINYVFLLNKFWTFKARGVTHRQILRFYILAGCNYLLSVAWIWLWTEQYHFNYLLARLANIAFAVGWNFLLYKYWVYRETTARHLNSTTQQHTDL